MSALDRRSLLRGAGVALALPWLEAMAPHPARGALPLRLAFVYAPNGVNVERWRVTGEGDAFELSATLAPLAPFRDDLLVLDGLALDGARPHGDGPGDHARAAGAFLTAAHPSKTGPVRAGTSVDQVAARTLGNDTRLRSLELGCEAGRRAGECDSGYACVYSSEISWSGPSTPNAKEIDPRLAFERLFAADGASLRPAERARLLSERRSVLDFVREDSARLGRRLGRRDREKLDEYLTGVRELERRLDLFALGDTQGSALPAPPAGLPADRAEHARALIDLIVLAFQGDLTRVASLMLANEGSNRAYPELEAPEGHHTLSHHGSEAEKLEKIARIDRFHVQRLAYLLERLSAVEEEDGAPLLERCALVYGSGIADGNRHAHHDLPILVAGRAGGQLAGGRRLQYARDTPLANLYSSLLAQVGAAGALFGDATGTLKDLGPA